LNDEAEECSVSTSSSRRPKRLTTRRLASTFALSPDGHCGCLVRRLLVDGEIEIVTSAPILDEIVDVLACPRLTRRYGFTPDEVKQFVAWIWATT